MTVTTSPAAAPAPPLVTVRRGTAADQAAVAALHDRCSDESRYRRFHAPLPHMPTRLVRATLEPENGWSLLAELGPEVVGIATAGPLSTVDLEVGVLVEDRYQGFGIGTRLLLAVAEEARLRGYRTLLCLTQPDNEAVVGSVARSGLPSRTAWYDGLMSVVMDCSPGA